MATSTNGTHRPRGRKRQTLREVAEKASSPVTVDELREASAEVSRQRKAVAKASAVQDAYLKGLEQGRDQGRVQGRNESRAIPSEGLVEVLEFLQGVERKIEAINVSAIAEHIDNYGDAVDLAAGIVALMPIIKRIEARSEGGSAVAAPAPAESVRASDALDFATVWRGLRAAMNSREIEDFDTAELGCLIWNKGTEDDQVDGVVALLPIVQRIVERLGK